MPGRRRNLGTWQSGSKHQQPSPSAKAKLLIYYALRLAKAANSGDQAIRGTTSNVLHTLVFNCSVPIIGVGVQSFARILIGNLLLNKFHSQGLVSAIELIPKFIDHQLFCYFHSSRASALDHGPVPALMSRMYKNMCN